MPEADVLNAIKALQNDLAAIKNSLTLLAKSVGDVRGIVDTNEGSMRITHSFVSDTKTLAIAINDKVDLLLDKPKLGNI